MAQCFPGADGDCDLYGWLSNRRNRGDFAAVKRHDVTYVLGDGLGRRERLSLSGRGLPSFAPTASSGTRE
jgi:hypothetical protein